MVGYIINKKNIKMNNKISDMVNEGREDAVIINYIADHSDMSLNQAREKLAEAKKLMAWYAHISNKEAFIQSYE